jgi:NAD(P)-dependent dehydrogenase (short-subunit alcohol dehydrogenase family)
MTPLVLNRNLPSISGSTQRKRKRAFTGIYAASKHAVEAIAETMKLELQEFGIEVATVNPGPFLTGFNDRMFQTHEGWEDDPSQRLFDYSKLAFPRAQYDPRRCTPP